MKLSGFNLLGSHTSGIGQERFRAINPATLRELDTEFIEAMPEEIDQLERQIRQLEIEREAMKRERTR